MMVNNKIIVQYLNNALTWALKFYFFILILETTGLSKVPTLRAIRANNNKVVKDGSELELI